MIDRRPALIVQAVEEADVVAAVTFARTNGLPVSIRAAAITWRVMPSVTAAS